MRSTGIILFFLQAALQINAQDESINRKLSNDSITIFSNTTFAYLKKDYVQLEATPNDIMYLFYPVSTIKEIKPDALSIRKYFWKTYLSKMFASGKIDSLLTQNSNFDFTEGFVISKSTGDSCYIITDTILENTGKLNATVAFATEVISSDYKISDIIIPTGNKHISPFYRRYNRFIGPAAALTGTWKEIVYTENYNSASGYMHGNKSTYFQFTKDSSYQNQQTAYAGSNLVGLSRTYDFKGKYKTAGQYIFFINRKGGRTEKFEYWFEALGRNEKALHLKNDKGEHYKLLKQPDTR